MDPSTSPQKYQYMKTRLHAHTVVATLAGRDSAMQKKIEYMANAIAENP